MSHIEEGKTNLVFNTLPALLRQGNQQALSQHPCIRLLRQAVLLVAKQYDGEVKPYYYTYRYRDVPANTGIALHIQERAGKPSGEALPRGLGMVVDEETGALKFLGDSWEVDETFYQSIQKAIIQKYTALAHVASLRQMNYQVSTEELADRINVTGGTYAA
jgi:hypothetical protein